jgi:hypothetical protein
MLRAPSQDLPAEPVLPIIPEETSRVPADELSASAASDSDSDDDSDADEVAAGIAAVRWLVVWDKLSRL